MKAGRIIDPSSRALADAEFAEVLHGLSQPLTTLECGLELAIRYDTTMTQVRHRLKFLLEAARVLHQRLLELRMLRSSSGLTDRGTLAALDKSAVE
jgi:hypothetical protein